MKRIICLTLIAGILLSLSACSSKEEKTALTRALPETAEQIKASYENAKIINLKETSAELDGKKVSEYDYTWNFDTSKEEPYYTGKKPSGKDTVYIAHDIVYYPETDASAFTKEDYNGETEWVTRYTAEGLTDYIFSTLPVLGNELPEDMMHSAEEAYKNPVLHITKAGEYIITGKWNGQILIDLGDKDKTFADESAKVTLIMGGADINCTVAPGIIFYSVYECDNKWEDRSEYGNDVDIKNAGAKIIIADGSENSVTGTNVYRLLKPEYKKEGSAVQKKLCKTDGALYSYSSLLIDGEKAGTGILNITSTDYEGLDSELHLTINGGYINIVSADDGINVNEDNVSVFTMNGGHLVIFAGQGAEGDVVDSNGYITVNGGYILGTTPSPSDDILDCDCEKKVSDGAVVINGSRETGMGGAENPMPNGNNGQMPGGEPPQSPPDGRNEPPQKPQ